MANVRFTIEYNGTRFSGWQEQAAGIRTVQGELKRALTKALRAPITGLTASGRTDAGVHARGQIVSFRVEGEPDLFRLSHAVSSILRGEVAVVDYAFVPESFNACSDAIGKFYRYTILNRRAPAVLDRRRAWFVSRELDVDRMRAEAAGVIGEHDFSSLRASSCDAPSPVKAIYSSEVSEEPPYIFYDVRGSGFLKNMVRIIAGTLVAYGRGELEVGSIKELLKLKDRKAAGPTAPAYGLCLERVYYPGDKIV